MSRPTRVAAAKLKNYSEVKDNSDDEDSRMSDDEDDSFDEDEDPDKIEVPGGGTNLEEARKIVIPTKLDQLKQIPSSSSIPMGIGNLPPRVSSGQPKVGRKQIYPTNSMAPNNSNFLQNLTLPEGTTISQSSLSTPNPLFDASMFGNPATASLGYNNPNSRGIPFQHNPIESLNNLQRIFNSMSGMLPKDNNNTNFGGNSPDLLQLYSQLIASAGFQLDSMNMPPPISRPFPGIPQAPQWGMQHRIPPVPSQPQEEETQEDEEALGVAETYSDYVPAKLKIGKPHPDPIVETASLASVSPPEVYYQLKLPKKCIEKGLLSALQLEAVVYACQQHEFFLESGERAGYLIGDGAGVGKGRTIAGIIFENWLCGRKKALWVSVSSDLKEDSERDLRDIGASNINVFPLNKLKYGKIKKEELKEGVLFSTYSGLIGESSTGGKFNARLKQIIDWLGKDFDGAIVFDECHRAKNLCPVGNTKPTKTGVTVQKLQDELPKARVVYASATGASEPKNMAYMTRLGIWGRGTPFREFSDFIHAVERRGIGAMEIVAMDMKLRGAYIARQLSFKGVSFNIEEVPLSESFQIMYDEAVAVWVDAMQRFIEAAELMKADNTIRKTMWAQFWSSHQRFFKYLCIAGKVDRAIVIAREAVKDGKCVVIGLQSTGEARTAEQVEREGELDDFVSTAKGVFQSLVEKHFPAPDRCKIRRLLGLTISNDKIEEPQPGSSSGKGKPMRKAAQNAAKRARWNDSDGSGNEELDSDFSDGGNASASDSTVSTDSKASDSEFDSVSSELDSDDGVPRKRGRKKKLIKKKPKDKSQNPKDVPTAEALDRVVQMRQELLAKIEKLGAKMPNNTLDHLIDELGGPNDVAEMTGRKMRLIQVDSGKIEYQSRAESDVALDHINLTEKQRFMDGKKEIAIISEAASSGISLQSDRRAQNKKRRVHITLELPWSADRAIQQFGRTHRSNQVNAPEYVFLISDLAGEHRFASIVAKRLESLGALTHGDRRATETRDLSRFHIDNKFGKMALESVMKYIMQGETYNMPALPSTSNKNFRMDVANGLVGVGLIINSEDNPGITVPDKDYHNMSKFLNRILGMPVKLQNSLFKFFTDTLAAIISNAKKQGRFDMGILNMGDSSNDKTDLADTQRFNRKHATGSGKIELHKVIVERGMSWDEAHQKYKLLTGKKEGFYVAKEAKGGKKVAVLITCDDFAGPSKPNKKLEKEVYYSIYRPSTGLQARRETLEEISSKYSKVEPDAAKPHWEEQFENSGNNCIHAFWSGKCKNSLAGMECDIGRRKRTYFVLSGSVLLCWEDIESVMSYRGSAKIQIVRVQFGDGNKFVGILIPTDCVKALKERLRMAEEMEISERENRLKIEKDEVEFIDNEGLRNG